MRNQKRESLSAISSAHRKLSGYDIPPFAKWPMNYDCALRQFDKDCSARVLEIEGCSSKWLLMKESFIEGWDSGSLYAFLSARRSAGYAFLFGICCGAMVATLGIGFVLWLKGT